MKDNFKNIILLHGAWHGGWCWNKVKNNPLLSNYNLYIPTLLGMNGYNDPFSKSTSLNSHIKQIENYIINKKLKDIILVGHSYAGMVITGVANKIPNLISKLIYLDAFIPKNNQSLFDLCDKSSVQAMIESSTDNEKKRIRQGAKKVWFLPVRDPQYFGVYDPDDVKFLSKKMVPMPILCFQEKISLKNKSSENISKYFIKCTKTAISNNVNKDSFDKTFLYYEIEAGHDVMISDPQRFVNILSKIIKKTKTKNN